MLRSAALFWQSGVLLPPPPLCTGKHRRGGFSALRSVLCARERYWLLEHVLLAACGNHDNPHTSRPFRDSALIRGIPGEGLISGTVPANQ